jgi:uncharacterized GH25 family protein
MKSLQKRVAPTVISTLALVVAGALPFAAEAHKPFMIPSETVLSRTGWITVDGAVGNDLFYFNHAPLRLDNLKVIGPDGQPVTPENVNTGKFRSTFELNLATPGTYKLALTNSGLSGQYETASGEKKRFRAGGGRGGAGSASGAGGSSGGAGAGGSGGAGSAGPGGAGPGPGGNFTSEIPPDAKNIQITQQQSRNETFVTAGKPNDTALQPTGVGLELIPVTHPNDLFAGEPISFKFVLDGKPAANLEVEVVPGGTRYRNKQAEAKFTTDKSGAFTMTWNDAGMYWLEASVEDDKPSDKKANKRRASYVATFEVLPP